MTFLSFSFLLFFTVLAVLYFLVPHKFQWVVLLVFSYAFYYLASEKLPIYMLVTTVVTYFAARWIGMVNSKGELRLQAEKDTLSKDEKKALKKKNDSQRKAILIVSIVLNLGLLAFFKYTDFLLDNFNGILGAFGVQTASHQLNLILPLGISFYTFQSTGYIIDVYRKKAAPEKNFFKAALFVSFFAQIVEGPIGRFDKLAPQLFGQHSFSFDRLKRNIFLILWGFVKKLVIADNLAPLVNEISKNYSSYGGFQILVGMLFYGIQLYTDFSGYMDIVTGFSGILGIELSQNFKRPYFSRSLTEFWRRWHITLCAWFRDYLFYPLFMSRISMKIGKNLRAKNHKEAARHVPTFIAMAIVWFLTGLWHGACWTEITWGFANGLIMIFSLQFEKTYAAVNKKLHIKTESTGWRIFQIIRTYLLVTLLNFICTFATLTDSVKSFSIMIKNLLPTSFSLSYIFPKLIDNGVIPVIITLFACLVLFLVSLYQEKKGTSLTQLICSKNWVVQSLVLLVMLFSVLLFSGTTGDLTGGFMYAQF